MSERTVISIGPSPFVIGQDTATNSGYGETLYVLLSDQEKAA